MFDKISDKYLVSIILPTYNRSKLLPRAIDSVLMQTYKNWELIVVDDGSNDDTQEVVKSYLDLRIKYLKLSSNQGPSSARNEGIKIAKGDFITFLDSDDEYLPTKVEDQVNLFLNSKVPNLGVVSCGRLDVDFENRIYFKWLPKYRGPILDLLLAKKRIGAGTPFLMVSKKVIESGIRFDPAIPCGEDYDFLVSVCKEFNFDFVPKSRNDFMIQGWDLMFNKYYNLLILNPNIYTRFILKYADVVFCCGNKHKALYILRKVKNYYLLKYLWFMYFKIFNSPKSIVSRIFLLVLRKANDFICV